MKKIYSIDMEEAVELMKAAEVILNNYVDDEGNVLPKGAFIDDPSFPSFISSLTSLISFLKEETKHKEYDGIIAPSKHTRIIDTILTVGKCIVAQRKVEGSQGDLLSSLYE